METYTLYFHKPDYEGLLAKACEAFPKAKVRTQVWCMKGTMRLIGWCGTRSRNGMR